MFDPKAFLAHHLARSMAFLFTNPSGNTSVGAWLEFELAEDWFIYARHTVTGQLYSISTEIWEEWLDVPEKEQQRGDAVEVYMLPVARKYWGSLPWKKEEDL